MFSVVLCTVVLHAIKSMDFYSRILFRISLFKFTFLELSSHTARCDKIAITKICVAEHTEIQHAWRQIYIEKAKKKRNDRKKHEVTPTITSNKRKKKKTYTEEKYQNQMHTESVKFILIHTNHGHT